MENSKRQINDTTMTKHDTKKGCPLQETSLIIIGTQKSHQPKHIFCRLSHRNARSYSRNLLHVNNTGTQTTSLRNTRLSNRTIVYQTTILNTQSFSFHIGKIQNFLMRDLDCLGSIINYERTPARESHFLKPIPNPFPESRPRFFGVFCGRTARPGVLPPAPPSPSGRLS